MPSGCIQIIFLPTWLQNSRYQILISMTYNSDSAKDKLKSLSDWKFENNAIEKQFVFKNFPEAISFMVRAGFICEKKNHHPDWTNVYNKLTIRLSTHDAGGVTDKDFDLASEIEKLAG